MGNQTLPSAQNEPAVVKYDGPTPAALIERFEQAVVSYETATGIYVGPARAEINEIRVALERAMTLGAAASELLAALKASCGYLLNAKIDLETGCTKAVAIRTIEGGLRMASEAIAKATGEGVTRITGGTVTDAHASKEGSVS